jgi:exopolyphosphatase/guanosine-5'-triphosphate,3'-diphosphate pyrophosphatase
VSARGGTPVAAAIDVGSNSVLLLVVAVTPDGRARALDEAVVTTRLGTGLVAGGALDAAAVARTTAAVVDFAGRARRRGASRVWGFATGAVRRACDGASFAASLAQTSGAAVEVLSGAREAALAYAAAVHGLGVADEPVLAIDVGGATTELTLGCGTRIDASASLPVGALALAETCGSDLARARAEVASALSATDLPSRSAAAGATVLASGGTATSLAALALGLERYEPRRVHGALLAAGDLAALARRPGGAVDPGRAAILPAGACILAAIMQAARAERLRVSDHGVRHAYLRERLAEDGLAVSMESLWG